jgi:hypothetical protein
MANNILINRGRVARIIAIILLIICLGISIACKSYDNVTYEVTGDADQVDIKAVDDDGITQEYSEVPLPWRAEYGRFADSYVYLYAYNTGDSGSMTVTIYVNGQVFKSLTKSTPYADITVYGNK